MGAKYPNPRRIKIHRNYTVEEIAKLLGVHKHTVRRWEGVGLSSVDQRRPKLFRGVELHRFLTERRARARRPCPPGYLYCFRCKEPKRPAFDCADLLPMSESIANLCGICECGALMYRRVGMRTAAAVCANLTIVIPEALIRIGETHPPTLNGDFIERWKTYANAQR